MTRAASKRRPVRDDHLPPYSEEAEGGALACIVSAPDRARGMLDQLSLAFFYDVRHRAIFSALAKVLEVGRTPEAVNLREQLRDDGRLEDAGGLAYVLALPDQTPSPANFTYYLPILKDKSARRGLLQLAAQARNLAEDTTIPGEALPGQFEEMARHILASGCNAKSKLPAIEDCAAVIETPLKKPQEQVAGLLHQGTKIVIDGGSKSFKTWAQIDLAASIATGAAWWGMDTNQGRVLYANFEIPQVFFRERLAAVLEAKGVSLQPGAFDHWCLRGKAVDFDQLRAEFISRLSGRSYALIVLDPVYKLRGRRDENSAGDIATLLNGFEHLAVETGAAIAFGAHYSKGNQASKDSIDRISGSGVFARDPDTILTLTRHEEDNVFSVEPILRNLPPVPPFCVRWEYPLMRRVDLDPSRLKQASGRRREYQLEKLLVPVIDRTIENPISVRRWADLAEMPRQTLTDYLPELRARGWIGTKGEGSFALKYVTPEGQQAAKGKGLALCRK